MTGRRWGWLVLAGLMGLAACGGANAPGASEDPLRTEFLAICQVSPDQVRIEAQSQGRIKTADYCACVYDKTVRGLSDAEAKVAAFYLMSPVGASQADLQKFRDMDLTAMGAASEAIGKAAKRCPAG